MYCLKVTIPILFFLIIAFERMSPTPHHKSEHKCFPNGHCQLLKSMEILSGNLWLTSTSTRTGRRAPNCCCQPRQSSRTYFHVRYSLLLFPNILNVLLNTQHTHGSCSFPDAVCSEGLVQNKNLVIVLFWPTDTHTHARTHTYTHALEA